MFTANGRSARIAIASEVAAHLTAGGGAIVIINTAAADNADLRSHFLTLSERKLALRKAPGKRATFAAARDFVRHVQLFLDRHAADNDGGPIAAFSDFVVSASGKPEFVVRSGMRFSISHSERLTAVAMSRSGRVGIDVERNRHFDQMDDVTRRFFTRDEHDRLAALAPPERRTAFFRLWTSREAMAKAFEIPVVSLHTTLVIQKIVSIDEVRIYADDALNSIIESHSTVRLEGLFRSNFIDQDVLCIGNSEASEYGREKWKPGGKTKTARCCLSTCSLLNHFTLSCVTDCVDRSWRLWSILH